MREAILHIGSCSMSNEEHGNSLEGPRVDFCTCSGFFRRSTALPNHLIRQVASIELLLKYLPVGDLGGS